jgi:hypothetical protein
LLQKNSASKNKTLGLISYQKFVSSLRNTDFFNLCSTYYKNSNLVSAVRSPTSVLETVRGTQFDKLSPFRYASSHLETAAGWLCRRYNLLRDDSAANTNDGFPKLPRLWLVKKILSNRDTERNTGLVLGKAENYFSSRIFYYDHSLESYRKRHPVQRNYIH